MFSLIGLFKQINCPEQPNCYLPNCIFAHHILSNGEAARSSQQQSSLPKINNEDKFEQDRPRKKRRLSKGADDDTPRPAVATKVSTDQRLAAPKQRDQTDSPEFPHAASREISPPLFRSSKVKGNVTVQNGAAVEIISTTSSKLNTQMVPAKTAAEESLNPRMIPNPPAAHGIRMQLIKMAHEQMVRLNEEVKQSQDPEKPALSLSAQELIIEALEEEETIASQNPSVYLNIVKLRITKLKKMKLSQWKEERLKQIAKRAPINLAAKVVSVPQIIETGLSSAQEIAFLSKLLAKQGELSKHGYVPRAPSDEEVTKARAGFEAGQGWEQCDRCKTRFQIFPGRREEDGALTSGGTCLYHNAKPRRPVAKDNADKGHRDLTYACCNQSVGTSVGCTTAATHVFKISEAKRLALVMPFKDTPPKMLTPGPNIAVCFDCEMGYTTMGLELIRLTATSWPGGEGLFDVLVRPIGEILDLNSQYSGVWPNDYANALPYEVKHIEKAGVSKDSKGIERLLRIVDSPAIARDLLFEHLTPETPLIGHALDNDLNATRIIHPSIVDTVLLYPHPRGLPVRFGLKVLMKKHLDRDIQMGGDQGHDSKEDARAAGDLVRLKVAEMWKSMKSSGWTVRKTDFFPPLPNPSKKASPFGSYGTQAKA
ncbi:RNA exonuclease 3 [Mycoblastus sanguinarius]|nr:RNA exonuclease 3 [Mycoblastus sanguinarius]